MDETTAVYISRLPEPIRRALSGIPFEQGWLVFDGRHAAPLGRPHEPDEQTFAAVRAGNCYVPASEHTIIERARALGRISKVSVTLEEDHADIVFNWPDGVGQGIGAFTLLRAAVEFFASVLREVTDG